MESMVHTSGGIYGRLLNLYLSELRRRFGADMERTGRRWNRVAMLQRVVGGRRRCTAIAVEFS
jgi:hypothetical protein